MSGRLTLRMAEPAGNGCGHADAVWVIQQAWPCWRYRSSEL